MKTKNSRPKLWLAGLVALGLAIVPTNANRILTDDFNESWLTPEWTPVETPPTLNGGAIHFKTVSDREESHINSGLRSNPHPELNFTKHPVEIIFEDLSSDGTANPASQGFYCRLYNTRQVGDPSTETILFRVSALGACTLATQTIGPDGTPTIKTVLALQAELPFDQIQLELNKKTATLRVTSASGTVEKQYVWLAGDFDPKEWADVSPTLAILATRSPGAGDSSFSLGMISVEFADQ